MKKILFLFGALSLLVTSCSSDDNSSESPVSSDSVLLQKTITTDSDGEKITTIYKYDGNKIVSMVDGGEFNLYFTYTGNLITKIEYRYPDGDIEQINTYSYTADGKLSTFTRIDPEMDWGNKEVYKYNADGTVTAVSYSGDSKSQTLKGETATIKFINGEVSEIITDEDWGSHKYTYDTKHNPLKNVIGFDKLAFEDGEADGVNHNMLTDIDISDDDLWKNSTYTYNKDGYPVKEVDKGTDTPGTTEFFYN